MDGGDRRTSQYAPPYQASAQGRPAPGQPMGPPVHDRYVQSLQNPARTDVGRASVGRAYSASYGAYGYQDQSFTASHMDTSNPMPGVEMQYPGYVQDPARSHIMHQPQPHQQYPTYTQSAMLPPLQQQSIYDAMPHFEQQRQSTALEVLTGGFGMPQYMQHGEHGTFAAAGPSSHYVTSQPDSGNYPNMGVTRAALQAPFSTSSMDYPMRDQADSQESQEPDHDQEALEADMRRYEQQLKLCFNSIAAGRVTKASDKLLELSKWLLSSVVPLGLHLDDESRYDQRLLMWREFNHCWEALGQKQKDITEEALHTRHAPSDLLSVEAIDQLMEDFITLCDQVEQYGLVDYEMGVWEDQISGIFSNCRDLLQQVDSGHKDDPSELGAS